MVLQPLSDPSPLWCPSRPAGPPVLPTFQDLTTARSAEASEEQRNAAVRARPCAGLCEVPHGIAWHCQALPSACGRHWHPPPSSGQLVMTHETTAFPSWAQSPDAPPHASRASVSSAYRKRLARANTWCSLLQAQAYLQVTRSFSMKAEDRQQQAAAQEAEPSGQQAAAEAAGSSLGRYQLQGLACPAMDWSLKSSVRVLSSSAFPGLTPAALCATRPGACCKQRTAQSCCACMMCGTSSCWGLAGWLAGWLAGQLASWAA